MGPPKWETEAMNEEGSPEVQIVTVAPCSETRPRTDTASIAELDDGHLLIAYHGYLAGPEAGDDFGSAVVFLRESHDDGATSDLERRCRSPSRTTAATRGGAWPTSRRRRATSTRICPVPSCVTAGPR